MENKNLIMFVLALAIGTSGLGMGIYSVISYQVIEGPAGPQGPSGEDGKDGINGVDGINGTDGIDGVDGVDGINGTDGIDAPGSIVIGILAPGHQDIISGIIEIKALVAGSDLYTLSVLRNGSQIGTQVPLLWDTNSVSDGWWNITTIATDMDSGNVTQDYVVVFVLNTIIDNYVYYCSTELELNNALNSIGTGSGTIYITNSITLSSTININGGGSYIIQGYGKGTVIGCTGDQNIFDVQNAIYCKIQNLKIDTSNMTVHNRIININEVNDNPIYIENILPRDTVI